MTRAKKILAQVVDAFERRRTGFPLGYETETAIIEAARAALSAPPESECDCRAKGKFITTDGLHPHDCSRWAPPESAPETDTGDREECDDPCCVAEYPHGANEHTSTGRAPGKER